MKYPLKNTIYEKLEQQKNILDIDLLNELKKDDPDISYKELNKVLFQLEIMGLITMRWMRKDLKRIEIIERS